MMRFFLTVIILFCANSLFAQKPVLDSTAYKAWPSLDWPIISKNGKYVFYNIENLPIGSKTLVVQSTDGKWKKEFKGGAKDGNSGALSDKYFFFINKNDSLGMFTLGTNQIKYIPNISWCRLEDTNGAEYLLYSRVQNPKSMALKNLKTNKENDFTDVDSWSFEKDILVLIKSIQGTQERQSINLGDIATGKISKIWEGNKPENLILDAKHRQLAFKTRDLVWYYKFDSSNAVCIYDKNSPDIESGLSLGYLESFSKDGKFIFTSLIRKGETIKPKNGVVEIWSYRDVKLQTEQEHDFYDQRYLSVINISDHKLVRLQQKASEMFQFASVKNSSDTLALVINRELGEHWSIRDKLTTGLISIKSGERRELNFLDKIDNVNFSPCGKYLIYFDRIQQNYFSYEIASGIKRNLTNAISVSWYNRSLNDEASNARGIAGWLNEDTAILVYDENDIWKLDPTGGIKPINLTNGCGKRNNIVFNLSCQDYMDRPLDKNEKLIISGFNRRTKENGFYRCNIISAITPQLLTIGNYIYYIEDTHHPYNSNFKPIKSKNASVYLVRRMSSTEAPNYFITTDFKIFKSLSNLQPEKKYNWYTTELHNWKSLDGRNLQGILYKPENFNPNKKYPIIFLYYTIKSDNLNAYIQPEPLCDGCMIDIPTYLSNEYLVFTPDVPDLFNGQAMQGTYNAIISAAKYISGLPFVDSKKIGLQGCSFGGIKTNYLVTHTNLFAAACSASGVSDLVSGYGGLISGQNSTQGFYEAGDQIGASLWEEPNKYVENSAIFQVHNVTTPLLIMHTKKDGICLYPNAIEFFTGLRRMGKRAWMLDYTEGNHAVSGKEADDFSIRMMQFFDHYLKDKSAPVWMVDGVAAKNRSWEAGLELVAKGRTPGSGLLTLEEQLKVDSMMTRKPIHIILK